MTGLSASLRDALLESIGWQDVADLTLTSAEAIGGRGWPHPDPELCVWAWTTSVTLPSPEAPPTIWSRGHRSGAFVVAGVLAGGHDRATLAAAPHTQLIDSIAELPTVVTSHEARSANSFM